MITIKAKYIEALLECASKDGMRYNLVSIHFNRTTNQAEATDGHQLLNAPFEGEIEKSVLFTSESMKTALDVYKIKQKSLKRSNKQYDELTIELVNDQWICESVDLEVVSADFPDTNVVIPKRNESEVVAFTIGIKVLESLVKQMKKAGSSRVELEVKNQSHSMTAISGLLTVDDEYLQTVLMPMKTR